MGSILPQSGETDANGILSFSSQASLGPALSTPLTSLSGSRTSAEVPRQQMFAKSSESLDVLHALTSARCLYRSSLEDARLSNKVAVKSGRGESPKTVSDL